MNSIIGNKYMDIFNDLNIEVSKKLNGEYSVDINLPSPWGHIGATVMVGDIQYSKSISIVNQLSEIRLNALESFRLKGLSAGYISADTPAGDRRMIASDQNGIDVKDIDYIRYKGRFFILCHFPIANEEFIKMF